MRRFFNYSRWQMMGGLERAVTERLTMTNNNNNNIMATDIYQALPMCTILRDLQFIALFILIISLWNRYYYLIPHRIGIPDLERLSNLSKVIQLVSGGTTIWTQVLCFQSPLFSAVFFANSEPGNSLFCFQINQPLLSPPLWIFGLLPFSYQGK